MRLIVAIPTTGRPDVVVPTIQDIARQTLLPDLVLVTIARPNDIDAEAVANLPFPVQIIVSPLGLTLQRNAALDLLVPEDVVLFLDDDFVMVADYLLNLKELFTLRPEVVMATGTVLADGIHGPGLSHDDGRRIMSDSPTNIDAAPHQIYNCYGCNMAVRAAPVIQYSIRFDDRMKLYAWLEDVDFSRLMAAHGQIVKSPALRGVHLGTKTGRTSGLRIGYVQVANPLYLVRKGTMSRTRAMNIMLRNIASNLVKSLRPEAEIDRRGRLWGNISALGDLVRGRIAPEGVLKFK
ncbi:glycosyltransferase family 2 protein [Falsihalocynthiibacter sp. S25ZX9]|uniref:glycosyltransferase family 2 protein n=1 Tax=Falsihalocynthiibacter sp. S25ZX9 TaxID=3240870 RepID=UPI00350F2D77